MFASDVSRPCSGRNLHLRRQNKHCPALFPFEKLSIGLAEDFLVKSLHTICLVFVTNCMADSWNKFIKERGRTRRMMKNIEAKDRVVIMENCLTCASIEDAQYEKTTELRRFVLCFGFLLLHQNHIVTN